MAPAVALPELPVMVWSLMPTVEAARSAPRGPFRLTACRACGLVANAAFDAALTRYAGDYEESQALSPSIAAAYDALARHLVDAGDSAGRTVVEVGCGQGDFLACLLAGAPPGVDAVPAPLGPAHHPLFDRLAVCRMTLEHLERPIELLSQMHAALAGDPGRRLFVEVPNGEAMLDGVRIWDLVYEHPLYFTRPALARLLARAGFTVTGMQTGWGGEWLGAWARPATSRDREGSDTPDAAGDDPAPAALARAFDRFAAALADTRAALDGWFSEQAAAGRSVVLWGSGAKAVGLLSLVPAAATARAVVDINPRRQGSFLPPAGLPVIAPEDLARMPADRVVVVNDRYLTEVQEMLSTLGPLPETQALGALARGAGR
jgi:hypothetical protein